MNLRQRVLSGKLTAEEAIASLKLVPGGGKQTQTYRRLKRLNEAK